ncbi:hypothetical protein [Methylobacterium sp. 77]|uniref:hypothetical protein n=1 Tax=Methylobacterium sp. 77 TaxID=1101192 RepID=UPI00037FA356|nr:hypothetical protein [Methylobacterium sp. 77]
MRTRLRQILLTIAACVGLASVAEAAPLPIAGASDSSREAIETVQYYGGGYGYRGGGYGYGHSPEHRYRQHIRREFLHERRYDAHLRRQDQHYRRAYRYGY